MNPKRKLRRLVERMTGTRMFRTLPFGIDVLHDIQLRLPGFKFQSIFDVGANVGHLTRDYVHLFPQARVYSFEPVQGTYDQLHREFGHLELVRCFKLALGARQGEATMCVQSQSTNSFLVSLSDHEPHEGTMESVDLTTLDQFCREQQIDHISYLKIDTEGGDLDVLLGADQMLQLQSVDIVQVEAGMNPGNAKHVRFEKLKETLEQKGYFLFGIYEQVAEFPTGEPHLRRTNPVFISQKVIEANKTAAQP